MLTQCLVLVTLSKSDPDFSGLTFQLDVVAMDLSSDFDSQLHLSTLTSTTLLTQILEEWALLGEAAAFACLITVLSSCLPTSLRVLLQVCTCCPLQDICNFFFLLNGKLLPLQWRNENSFCELDHSFHYFSGSISYHLPKSSTWLRLRNSKNVAIKSTDRNGHR